MISLQAFSPNSSLFTSFQQKFAEIKSSRTSTRNVRIRMCSDSLPPLPQNRIVVGCGMAALDFLAVVDAFPEPDEKIRSTSFKSQGGGNAGNALTCAARLGLNPRIISKVADDSQGRGIIEEFKKDGVDTSFLVVSEGGNSTFSYNIVDNQTKTRTSIYTPGYPPLAPEDLPQATLLSALDGAQIVYFDGISLESTLLVAQEAVRKNIPILAEAESICVGLDDILIVADYVVCSTKFPQAWTGLPSLPCALVSILLRLPKVKFAIVTLGEDGCIMLERSSDDNTQLEEMDVETVLEVLKGKKDDSVTTSACVSSEIMKFRANGVGTVDGRLHLGTAEKIPPSELVDTTGAGDAFIGAILYALCAKMPPEKTLPFASQVAASNCKALGARGGLPYRADPRLSCFLL